MAVHEQDTGPMRHQIPPDSSPHLAETLEPQATGRLVGISAGAILPLTLLLADDHPLILDSLRSLFELVPWIGAIKLARNGLELCELAQSCTPDAAVVDLSLPRLDGLSSIRRLRHRDPHLAIVAITGATHCFPPAEVSKAGADEYLDKNQPGEVVVAALRRALIHHGYRIGALPFTPPPPPAKTEVALTEREREVLKLLAEGYDVEASAALLAISPALVRKHREHLFAKLETSNTALLTLIAVRRGIVLG